MNPSERSGSEALEVAHIDSFTYMHILKLMSD